MQADPIVFVAKLVALLISVEMANLVAPHLVIAVAGASGATLGLMDWRKCTRVEAFAYVIGFTVLAWLLAGSLAEIAASLSNLKNPQWLLSPCAIGIGWVGHRWPKVALWAVGVARAAIEKRPQPPTL